MKFGTARAALLAAAAAFLSLGTLNAHQPVDKGDFKVVYERPKNATYVELQKNLQTSGVLESIAEDLNKTFALPYDITLSFDECGEANAFYDPATHKISICYELVEDLAEAFSKDGLEGEDLENAIGGATIFIFYHELGHALIDVLDLPVTGKEEDAVDQLSTYILADGTDEGESMALSGARYFYISSKDADPNDDLAMWDEHSLDQQRFYNILCWVYGQNEEKYSSLVSDGILPEERGERCGDEYAKIDKSWSTLLAPYIKE